jgi:hypothetical protein
LGGTGALEILSDFNSGEVDGDDIDDNDTIAHDSNDHLGGTTDLEIQSGDVAAEADDSNDNLGGTAALEILSDFNVGEDSGDDIDDNDTVAHDSNDHLGGTTDLEIQSGEVDDDEIDDHDIIDKEPGQCCA